MNINKYAMLKALNSSRNILAVNSKRKKNNVMTKENPIVTSKHIYQAFYEIEQMQEGQFWHLKS